MDYQRNHKDFTPQEIQDNLRFLKLLSKDFSSIESASTEIINLEAILNLPKGTEHFLSDIHAEYDTFHHVLSNASGVVKQRIDEVFKKKLRVSEKKALATLIYYPEEKLDIVLQNEADINEWYEVTLQRLIEITRVMAQKYSRSKVRKSLPDEFRYIIDELLNVNEAQRDKEAYFGAIIKTIIEIDRASAFIVALCKLIKRLAIDRLHIVGDIFDRGPHADKVMDEIMNHHSVDIQWGNHDVVWMGAAAGSLAYIAVLLRISARYDNLDTLEEAYGINLLPLATFAFDFYREDKCEKYTPKSGVDKLSSRQLDIIKKIHKAISIIQYKLEGQIIKRNPHFEMNDRLVLEHINYEKGTITIDGVEHPLLDKYFPTIDPKNPYELTKEELDVMLKLRKSFRRSEKLQRHVNFLYDNGSMYLKYNKNLLFHGAIPMNEDKSFKTMDIYGEQLAGKAMIDKFDMIARRAYYNNSNSEQKQSDLDYMWYLWCGPISPLFGKRKMATFETYFVADKETHKEERNSYYNFRNDVDVMKKILREFDLDEDRSHIINGHVPVKVIKGESPVKADGKLIVIDGGMSEAYQKVTGIAGYTLIYNSYGLVLVAHQPFESKQKAIEEETDILSSHMLLAQAESRKLIADTDVGEEIKRQIFELKMLLYAFNRGFIKEKR